VATAGPPSGAITVSPATDLVDGQTVTVDGTGFEPRDELTFWQCTADLDDCRRALSYDTPVVVGDDGTFAGTARVRAVFPSRHGGSIDCRTQACLMAADYGFRIDSAPAERRPPRSLAPEGDEFPLASTSVAFDPSAPLAPAPTLLVDPATQLVDGQTVQLSGSGYRPNADIDLAFCLAQPSSFGGCDFSGAFPIETHADPSGAISLTLPVFTMMASFDQPADDCRVVACSLVTFEHGLPDDRLGEAPLDFDPDAALRPSPEVHVNPGTGLADGQEVTVSGSGFRPGEQYFIEQCLDDGQFWDCTSAWHGGAADDDGDLSHALQVRAEFNSFEDVDCRDQPCILVLYGGVCCNDGFVMPLAFEQTAAPPNGSPPADPLSASPLFTG
jgi:hypothetical protein